jgi:hypothetical protein
MEIGHPDAENKSIRVELAEKKGNELRFKLYWSESPGKYFNTDEFFVKYDTNIDGVDESILYIPAIANLAPVSWAIGADLYVDRLDGAFLDSLHTIKAVMKRMYPNFSCAGEVRVGSIVGNEFGHTGSAQLFTGGIDSLATYAIHRDEKPDLISFSSYTPYDRKLQQLIYNELSEFARKTGSRLHRVGSNLQTFLNERTLIRDFGNYFPEASWWASAQHGM